MNNKTPSMFAAPVGAIATFAAALLPLLLAACGGGAETKTGSNGTGVAPPPELGVTSGPIAGLGPLDVAGARLDDATTVVLVNTSATQTSAELRLGMFADAAGNVVLGIAAGAATAANAQSLVRGPVTRVDAAAQSLSVLSLPVRVDQNTLLDGVNGIGDIVLGDSTEVYGLKLPGNAGTLATRLVVRRPAVGNEVELLGTVGNLNASSLVADGVQVSLASVQVGVASPGGVQFSAAPVNALVPGALVRVIGTYNTETGVVMATRIATGFAPARPDTRLVYIEGFVREFAGVGRFKVGDLDVDASGTTAALAEGARVKVRGRMQGNVLRADQLSVVPPGTRIEFILEGTVSSYTSIGSFSLRGERVDASQAQFVGGAAANLQDGRRVRVKGVAGPGRLTASEVTFVQ